VLPPSVAIQRGGGRGGHSGALLWLGAGERTMNAMRVSATTTTPRSRPDQCDSVPLEQVQRRVQRHADAPRRRPAPAAPSLGRRPSRL